MKRVGIILIDFTFHTMVSMRATYFLIGWQGTVIDGDHRCVPSFFVLMKCDMIDVIWKMVLDDFFCTIDNLFYTGCTVGVI
jgi:hypothetical protein